MTALELSRQHHDFCIQALSFPLDQECVDISYTPTLVWHPISWSVYEIYDCISEDPPCSSLCLDIDANCSPELPTVLWSGMPGSYMDRYMCSQNISFDLIYLQKVLDKRQTKHVFIFSHPISTYTKIS